MAKHFQGVARVGSDGGSEPAGGMADGASREEGWMLWGAPPAGPAQAPGAGRARPAGPALRSPEVLAVPAGAVGGQLLPPPVRRAMPCGEGPRALLCGAWGSRRETISSLQAWDCHLREVLVVLPCLRGQPGSQPSWVPLLAADLSHCIFSRLHRAMTSFLSAVCSFWVSWPPRSPTKEWPIPTAWRHPANSNIRRWAGCFSLAEQPWGALLSLFPLVAVHSSSQLHWPSQSALDCLSVLDTRAGCATLLCQSCLLAARPWPGSCPAAGQPAVTR